MKLATMKLHLFLALFVAQSLHADWVIVEKTNTGDKESNMTPKIKDGMIRNDIGKKMTVLVKGKDGASEMYMHDKKKVMRIDSGTLQSAGALANKFLSGGKDGEPSKPKATGEKAKVGEWDTEVYTWQSKLGSAKFYVAKDFPNYAELAKVMDKVSKSMNNPMSSLYPSVSELPGMVVKSEMTTMGRNSVTELVSATEQAVSADEFKGPEGYEEMKMPSFKGLKGGDSSK